MITYVLAFEKAIIGYKLRHKNIRPILNNCLVDLTTPTHAKRIKKIKL